MPEKAKKLFVGAFNAIKPENQGKKALELYDAVKYGKKTPEGKKSSDKIRQAIKNNPKLVGWGAIAVEAGTLALIAAKGISRLKKRSVRQGETVSEGNPLVTELDRLLRGEPIIKRDSFNIRTVIGAEFRNKLVAVTAAAFEETSIREIRVDVVDIVKGITEILLLTEVTNHIGALRVELPFTRVDNIQWPRIIPSDSLHADIIASDSSIRPASVDEMNDVAILLASVHKDSVATNLRQNLFRMGKQPRE